MAEGSVNERDPRRLARLRVEERIAEIRYQLVVGEAVGSNTGVALGGWDLEEELLDELAQLERALLAEDVSLAGPGHQLSGEGAVDRHAGMHAVWPLLECRIRETTFVN